MQNVHREMNPTLQQFFTEKILAPVKEWQKEADTNKRFYLGDKQFEYVATVTGHEPVDEDLNER